MVDRTTISAPCPGTATNYVTIIDSSWQCAYGIGNPLNTGNCQLFIHGMDANGAFINDGYLALNPGDSVGWYTPPSGSVKVVMACDSSCTGQTQLEYDLPNA
jgi:hypothetical protein